MQLDTQTAASPKWMFWVGWILTVLPALGLLASGVGSLMKPAPVLETFKNLGWDEDYIVVVGVIKIVCTLIYLFPRTSVLGAILLAGYLGGAVATNLRVHAFAECAPPIVFGVLLWGGLYLRYGAVRALIPWRS